MSARECCVLLRYAPCLTHGKVCSILPNVGQIHMAGTPCTAASTMGLRDFDAAMAHGHFLCWVSLRRQCQEPIIVQENVQDFDRRHLTSLLPMYDFTFSIISPCQLGFPVRRARQWCVLLGSKRAGCLALQ